MDKNSINERCCCHLKGATRAMETERKMKSQQAIPSHMRPNDPPKIKGMKIKKKKGKTPRAQRERLPVAFPSSVLA